MIAGIRTRTQVFSSGFVVGQNCSQDYTEIVSTRDALHLFSESLHFRKQYDQ